MVVSGVRNTSVNSSMFVKRGENIHDRYTKVATLGVGAFGVVLLCQEKTSGAMRAIKKMRLPTSKTKQKELYHELEVMKRLDHPNCMKIFEYFINESSKGSFFYLVSEAYSGGELFDEIIKRKKFSENDATRIIHQVLSGVNYLHTRGIIHRDLKPENLLLENKEKDASIKIIDFGLSTFYDIGDVFSEKKGTAYYIAPEILNNEGYNEKCDVWSCGVILYILMSGRPPFPGGTDQEIMHKVRKGNLEFPPKDWAGASKGVVDLIKKMLVRSVKHRPSAAECLNDPWFAKSLSTSDGTKEGLAIGVDAQVSTALSNMRHFYSTATLAKAAMLFIGSKLMAIEETKEMSRIFRMLDTNHDGKLDRNELIAGYSELQKFSKQKIQLTQEEIEQEVDEILAQADMDNSGGVEYSEFCTVCMDRATLLTKDKLYAAFKLFDKDNSGRIDANELRHIVEKTSNAEWDVILAEIDTDSSGDIDFEEFCNMMNKQCNLIDRKTHGTNAQ